MQLTKINGKYELWLPEHRAQREQWDIANGGWEVKRIDEMIKTIDVISLKRTNPVVFDVGSEEADISALLMKYTTCDMVLFEPNERVYGCIRQIWDANNLKQPLGFFSGFLSNKSTYGWINGFSEALPHDTILNPEHGFKQLYENYPDVPQVTMDEFCDITGLYPDAITMDVEGSEFNVMKGAEKILKEKKPLIFMSVHPEFMYIHYNEWVTPMLRFIDECGYTHDCIEYDYHELHMIFTPK